MKTLFALLLIAAGSLTTTSASSKVEPVTQYDSPTLLQGLILGHGPVARLFPEIYGAAGDGRGDWTAKDREAFIAHATAQDPDLLDDFSGAMRSGDHVRINDALHRARRVVGDFAAAPAPATGAQRGQGISWFAAINIIAAVNFRTAVNISVYLQIATEVFLYQDHYVYGGDQFGGMPSRLQHDYLVSLIAERFSPA